MNIKSLKKFTIITMMLFLIFNLSACGKTKKDIVISKDVKEEFKSQDKEDIRISKINDLNTDGKNHEPLCWKDDENFIAIDIYNKFKNFDIYNINIKTSKVTKVDTLKDIVLYTPMAYEINNNKLIYSNNNKLYIYDLLNNKSKEIWDLTEVKDEISKYGASINFVKGSDKYVSIITMKKQGKEYFRNIRILDMSTGKVVKSNDLKIPLVYTFMYSKIKDVFYTVKMRNIYEYKLSNPNELKKVEITDKHCYDDFTNISSDGRYIYCIVMKDAKNKTNGTDEIFKYDLVNDKFTSMLSEEGKYSSLVINSNTNNIAYRYSNVDNDKSHVCIGKIKENGIKNIKRIPSEKVKDLSYVFEDIMMNEEGNKFIYRQVNKDKNDSRSTLLKAYKIE
ncbi:hypothetical protein CLOACE_21660 [Clostridium acetireducens DSM 10703]|uniref:Lipoprotein n=1 Tax=Clostridium acetireducens DSM 10703 TaxID=1121290 RepID=A0A1E8EWK1_9CLOT|nr:hypothetical protein [Clostridium acetireducens]OFI01378.1 hypothetical protein CLOACE_21660 [Clostridium acetireducens DSM 10703]